MIRVCDALLISHTSFQCRSYMLATFMFAFLLEAFGFGTLVLVSDHLLLTFKSLSSGCIFPPSQTMGHSMAESADAHRFCSHYASGRVSDCSRRPLKRRKWVNLEQSFPCRLRSYVRANAIHRNTPFPRLLPCKVLRTLSDRGVHPRGELITHIPVE